MPQLKDVFVSGIGLSIGPVPISAAEASILGRSTRYSLEVHQSTAILNNRRRKCVRQKKTAAPLDTTSPTSRFRGCTRAIRQLPPSGVAEVRQFIDRPDFSIAFKLFTQD